MYIYLFALHVLTFEMFSDLFICFLLTYSNEFMRLLQTHPSQGCFMSSVDLHTHYSYQVLYPNSPSGIQKQEAVPNIYVFFPCIAYIKV